MKFLRLDLLAYGPFTNRTLDLPASGPNLHLIYGLNEAGVIVGSRQTGTGTEARPGTCT